MNAPITLRQLGAHEVALARIQSVLAARQPAICAYSGGKDSSVLVALTLEAALRLRATDAVVPPVVIVSSDTGVENPEVSALRDAELRRMEQFAKARHLTLETHIARPNLNDTWPVRVISGRALPTFENSSRDCTRAWKVNPLQKLQRALIKRLVTEWAEPVMMVGTRLDESAVRARAMRARGDDGDRPRRDSQGMIIFAPMAEMRTDDVWEVIGLAASGLFNTYSDFTGLKEVYASAGASECALVGDSATEELKSKRPCDSRTGCSVCLAVGERDKSLDAMISSSERYDYMRPLQKLREFLFKTRYDLDRRAWLGRSIDDDGYVAVGPDSYGPSMLEELLRYCLTIDFRVAERAARASEAPRFQLISIQQLFAIDFTWSKYGFARPFHALAIWREIERGARFDIPEIRVTHPRNLPAPRRLHVGPAWLDEAEAYGGLRDAMLESFDECGRAARELSDGSIVTGYDTADSLDVDEEGAWLFLMFEADRVLAEMHDVPNFLPTAAAFEYLHFGFVRTAAGAQSGLHRILKRTQWRHERGLTGAQCGNGRHLWDLAEEQMTQQMSLFGSVQLAASPDVATLDA